MKVTDNEKQDWISIAFIWSGALISVTALMIGGLLVQGLDFKTGMIAGTLGYFVVVLYMVLQRIEGMDTGLSTVEMASKSFGNIGSKKIIASLLAVSCFGWFGVQTGIVAQAFTNFMKNYGVNCPLAISSILWGGIMVITAIYGIKMLKILNVIAVPSLIVMCLYATYRAINLKGFEYILNHKPTGTSTFITAVGMTVGSFALGGVLAGDYSRYAKSRKDVLKSSFFGMIPAGFLMCFMGAVISVATESLDIDAAMQTLGLGIFGTIVLILATWTTNTVNAYSGGLAITNLFNLDKKYSNITILIAGIIGSLLSVFGILAYFEKFLIILTNTLPPVAGVMIADYWIINKGHYDDVVTNENFNIVGIISWIIGILAATYIKYGIAPINGIIVSMIVYVISYKVLKK